VLILAGVGAYLASGFLRPPSADEPTPGALTDGPAEGTEPNPAGDTETGETATTQAASGGSTADTVDTDAAGPTDSAAPTAPPPLVLEIASQPAGARLVIDGRETGEVTPAQVPFSAGDEHRLALELDGYRTAGWSFTVDQLSAEQRRDRRLFFPLEPDVPPAVIALEATYPVAVIVDGRRVAAARSHAIEHPPGSVEVTLVAAEVFFRQTKTLELESGERTELAVPRTVTATIVANPANCRISIDGQVVDFTPISDLPIVVGAHQVLFEWPALGLQKNLEVTLSRDGQRIFATADD
jgi:hypothetical protein